MLKSCIVGTVSHNAVRIHEGVRIAFSALSYLDARS